MAASTVSSAYIKNRRGKGTVGNPTYVELGSYGEARLKIVTGTLEVDTTSIDEANDKILLFPLRGTDRLVSLMVYNDDLDSNGSPALTFDVGIYKDVNYDGTSATAVSATCIATAVTQLQSANTTGVELRFEAADINGINKTLWELGGESTATSEERIIGLNVANAAATAAGGTLSWRAMVVSA